MERNDPNKAGKDAFERGFDDQEKLDASIDEAFERKAPGEFAAEKAADLAASSDALEKGGAQLHDTAERKGGSLTDEERTEEGAIEDAGKATAAEGAARLEAAARIETPPPLPSKEQRQKMKEEKAKIETATNAARREWESTEDDRLTAGMMAGELSKMDERGDAPAEEAPAAASQETPAVAKAGGADAKAEVPAEAEARLAGLHGRLVNAGIEGEQLAKFMKAAERKPEVAENAARALISKTARERVATLEAKLKKYEGMGKVRMLSGSARAEFAKLKEELENAKGQYNEARAEFVGDNVEKLTFEQTKLADEIGKQITKERGLPGKIYDSYKKLGELNVYNALKKRGLEPKGRIAKMATRAMSVRTLISVGLMGAGAAMATPAAAAVPLLARRMMSGLGTSIGSYDVMRAVADRKRSPAPEKIKAMTKEELVQEMEAAQARAMTGGKSLKGDESYRRMREAFHEKTEGTLTEQGIRTQMQETDARLQELKKKRERNDKIMKGVAAGIGIAVGGFMVSKDVSKLTEASGAEAVPDAMPGSADASLSPDGSVISEYTPQEHYGAEIWALSEVQKGDGVSHVLMRQLESDPARFGFDAAKGGDVHEWARKAAGKMVREAGYYGKGFNKAIEFNPDNPGRVLLVGDAKTGLSFQTLEVDTKIVPRLAKLAEGGKLSKDIIPGVGEITRDVPGAVDHAIGQLENGPHADLALLDTEEGRAALKEMAHEYVTKPEYGKFYSFEQLAMAKDWQSTIEKGLGHALTPAEAEDLRGQLSQIINKDLLPGETMMLTDMQNNPILGPDGAPMILRQNYDGRRAAQWLYEKTLGGKLEVSPDVAERLAAEKAKLAARQIVEESGVPAAADRAIETAGSPPIAEMEAGIDAAAAEAGLSRVGAAAAEVTPQVPGISPEAIQNIRASFEGNADMKAILASLSDEQVGRAMASAKQVGRALSRNQALIGESWVARGMKIEDLKDLAAKGAVAGNAEKFSDGTLYNPGYDAKMAARYALERMGVEPPPLAVEERMVDAAEAAAGDAAERAITELSPAGVAEVTNDLASGEYGNITGDEMKMGLGWLERNVSAEDLRTLAEKGAVAGGVERFPGGLAHTTGFEAKRAAQYALRKLAERAANQEI